MPRNSDMKGENRLLRMLIYGKAKTKKTWWSFRCAEIGFNVLHLEGDDQGGLIGQQLSLKAREKIWTVQLEMIHGRTVMAPFMAQFLNPDNAFIWDEQRRVTVFGKTDPTHSHFKFDASLLTPNDVLVVDGWKALAESSLFQYAAENKLDLANAAKTEWPGYGYQGRFLDWILARLHTLNCHIIVIGHETVYEKRDPLSAEHKIIEQRTQPISSSGPHARKLAAEFTDVLYFELYGDRAFKINTGGARDRDGGSRFFAPQIHSWDDLSPAKFFEKLEWKPTGEPLHGAQWFAPGVEIPRGNVSSPMGNVVIQNMDAAKPMSIKDRLAAQQKSQNGDATKGGPMA